MSEQPGVFSAKVSYADQQSAESARTAFKEAGFKCEANPKDQTDLFVTSTSSDAERKYTSITEQHRPQSEERGARLTRAAGHNPG